MSQLKTLNFIKENPKIKQHTTKTKIYTLNNKFLHPKSNKI